MRVSGFTFLRNAYMLGYPFVQSIKSVLPVVDEFIISLGPCDDDTERMINDIGSSKIKILHTQWNENMRTDVKMKGFVYGQQKSIALFNCTGDWAFYLEADEIIHENDLQKIKDTMERHLNDKKVEAIVFDYIHFYGDKNTFLWSPGWYRRAPRILRNNIPGWAPDGLFFIVIKDKKRGRYPRAVHSCATIYHYGWVRSEEQMNLKVQKVSKYWDNKGVDLKEVIYSEIDHSILNEFRGSHPEVMHEWLLAGNGVFKANPGHRLSKREIKHRIALKLEKLFGIDLSKKHFKLVR